MHYGFRNIIQCMLHSVYLRSLVDLENKSCVGVPLVNIQYIVGVPDVGFEYFRVLKNALQMPCESCLSETAHKPFEGLF